MVAENTLFLPILAILWLAFAWMWTKLGYKSKKGIMYLAVAAVWLIFYNVFQILAEVLPTMSSTITMIGMYIGGGLAFIFGLIATLTLVMEVLK